MKFTPLVKLSIRTITFITVSMIGTIMLFANVFPPPIPTDLLIDVTPNNTTPISTSVITYKFRYRYASTTEHGTNAQVQLTFPDAYEIVAPPLLGGNLSSISNTANQYTIDLESPASLGLPAGTLAAGSSGLFEFQVKFKCGINGTGDIPAAGTTVNFTQNPVFTVSGVSNTASTPSPVTVPTVNDCTVPTNSNTANYSKHGSPVVGQGMYHFWSLSMPLTNTDYTYTDIFPDGFKLYDGIHCCSNFDAGWTVEVQANGTWWEITNLLKVKDFIDNVPNGSVLKDQNGTNITGTMRVDAIVPNGNINSDQAVNYAEGVTGIRFTGSGSHTAFYIYMYILPTTPVGQYQNCFTSTNAAWSPDCDDIYVTDRGSLTMGCWTAKNAEGLGGTSLNSFHGNPLGINYPNLYKDPMDLQSSISLSHKIKTGSVSGVTLEALLPLGFDYVEGTAKPNYWVVRSGYLDSANPPSALIPVFTKIPNYNGTGQTLLTWEFPNLVFPAFGPHFINSSVVSLTLFYSYRYMGTHPLTSSNIFTETTLKTGSVMTGLNVYSSDLGAPIQEITCGSSYSIPTNGGSVNSEKYVQGSLDVQQSRFPITGNTDVSGDATYELYVYNHNFQKLKQIDITDILPYIGDKDMLGTGSRGSNWSEEITNIITVERYKIGSGLVSASNKIPNGVLYANTYNACYLDGALPAGQATAIPSNATTGQSAGCTDFSSSISANGAKGFAFQWLDIAEPLEFGEYLKITVNVNQLTGEADKVNNEVAWNSFAYTVKEEDDDVLFSSEPLKVGVKMIDVTNSTALGGRIWEDANGDGEQNAGEANFSDVTVSLYDASGNPITESVTISGVTSDIPVTTLTDMDGNYMFYGLTANTTYSIRLENESNFDPSGVLNNYTLTSLNQSGVSDEMDSDATEGTLSGSPATARPQITTATTGSGTTLIYNDFGFYKLASLGNYVWLDDDGEGDQDGSEAVVQGVTMTLKDGVTNATIGTDITDENGLYIFENLLPGNYYIVASTLPAGKIATGKQITGNSENDSDFNAVPSTETDIFTLNSGEVRGDLDLGLKDEVLNPAAICGRTWDDLDEDGVMEPNEPAQERINIDLLDGNGFVLSSTVSDTNGDYCFYNLTPNTTYQVAFLLPSTTGSDYTNAGTNMEASSTGLTLISYTPTANQTINNIDCGFIGPFSIGNLVWSDVNNNGIKDNGESTYSNISLYLYNNAGTTILDSTKTDAFGKYVFRNLSQGTYKVALNLPSDTRSSTDVTNTSNPNNMDNDDNGVGNGTGNAGLVFSNSIVLEFGGGVNTGANWTESDHGKLINAEYDPASNPKAYYTMDFGLVAVTNNCNNAIDNDGDGIGDDCDDDDDNDGILDIVECPTPTSSGLTGPLTTFTAHITTTDANSNAVPHTLDSLTYNGIVYRDFIVPDSYTPGFTLGDPTGVRYVKEGAFLFSIGSNPNYNIDILPAFQSRNLNAYQDLDLNDFSDGDYFDLKYNNPVISTSGGFIAVTERGGNNPQVIHALDANGSIIGGTVINVSTSDYVDVGVRVDPSGGQNANIALYPIDDLVPVGTEIYGIRLSFGTSSGAASDGPDAKAFLFGNVDLFACDYDGDGIPNHKDLDSDNDGCPDALEGDAGFTTADVINGRLIGGVENNGIPTIAGSGQTLGSSQDASTSVCIEICNSNTDDDGDGLIDCADPDCGAVSITNVAISNCINHPYADIATLDVTVSWLANSPDTTIEVTISGKTEYIDTKTATSPATVSFVVPADGSAGNAINVNFTDLSCNDNSTYNAPNDCSSDELNCSILYICGESKGGDADAFDHGLMQYIDGINGNSVMIGALSKNEAGQGLYDPINTSTLLNIDIDTFDIILVSSTTWGYISSTLITELKETEANLLLLSQDLLVDLAMASNHNYSYSAHAYTNNTTRVELYNFNNPNPYYAPLVGWGNYHTTTADAYLWKNEWDFGSSQQGVFFHYESTDVLGGVPATHGTRTFLGYMMDGVYWNNDTNMGVMPVPQAEWFDPIRHLTQAGKRYLDQAIKKASTNCNLEDCTNGIDDDGDGLIDCDDPDCQADNPTSIIPD